MGAAVPFARRWRGLMSAGLPAGTRVRVKSGAQQTGTVMPHEPEYSHGLFPVRLDDGIWQIFAASDVVVLAPPKQAGQ
ncbi:MAG TPA: hypothetical protein VGO16_13630 [Pseudonocardiaceae bacterium]|nr:hypothetical protein [Pseudonocardiaceae bacterium]